MSEMNHENEEHIMNNLEIFIDCLKEITEEFKNNPQPNFTTREEVNYITQ